MWGSTPRLNPVGYFLDGWISEWWIVWKIQPLYTIDPRDNEIVGIRRLGLFMVTVLCTEARVAAVVDVSVP